MPEKSAEIELLDEIRQMVHGLEFSLLIEELDDLQHFLTIAEAATRNLRDNIKNSDTKHYVAHSLNAFLGNMNKISAKVQKAIIEYSEELSNKCETLRLCLEDE